MSSAYDEPGPWGRVLYTQKKMRTEPGWSLPYLLMERDTHEGGKEAAPRRHSTQQAAAVAWAPASTTHPSTASLFPRAPRL